jgi:hypothetical protein
MRILGRRILSTVVFVVSLLFFVRVVLEVRLMPWRGVRHFNKYVLNPFAVGCSASKDVLRVLHHTGRHSGAAYRTPLVAKLTEQGIIMPLPYGEDTDWCRKRIGRGRMQSHNEWRGVRPALTGSGTREDCEAPAASPQRGSLATRGDSVLPASASGVASGNGGD